MILRLLTLLFIFSGVALGVVVGAYWPGVESTRIGPWSLAALVKPYLIILLPNLIFLGAIFLGLAALTRRMLPVFAFAAAEPSRTAAIRPRCRGG